MYEKEKKEGKKSFRASGLIKSLDNA